MTSFGGLSRLAIFAPSVLGEFLEVAIHQILYLRNIYPSGLFKKRQVYQIPVQMSVHPELNQYIVQTVASIKDLYKKDQIERVDVIIRDESGAVIEKFLISTKLAIDCTINDTKQWVSELEMSFRSFLLKLNVIGTSLDPLPKDCTFGIEVHTSIESGSNLQTANEDFPWVCTDSPSLVSTENPDKVVVPIKSIANDSLKMQIYVEKY
ncbi:mitotic spindle assembly checkpoint protein MAD2B-like isoform X2 [Oscarella lobularis]|uniref:mitotic spindle assembly checkpoint protein MAD2B-like isoform X2 n=1 Tax=Oscarella lobularis TaxID=121494 RepID=UPI003313F67F